MVNTRVFSGSYTDKETLLKAMDEIDFSCYGPALFRLEVFVPEPKKVCPTCNGDMSKCVNNWSCRDY
jgi:hypothetical protein